MNSFKISADNALERRAVEAKLERLGVRVQADSVSQAALDEVGVDATTIAEAIAATGSPNIINLSVVEKLDHGRPALRRLLESQKRGSSTARVRTAVMAVEGATRGLARLAEADTVRAVDLARLGRSIENASNQIQAAASDEVLSFTAPDDVARLRDAYTALLGKYLEVQTTYRDAANRILPQLGALLDAHNEKSIVMRALTLSRLDGEAGIALGQKIHAGPNGLSRLIEFAQQNIVGLQTSSVDARPSRVAAEEPEWRTALRTGDERLDSVVLEIFDRSEECYRVGHTTFRGKDVHIAVLGAGVVLFQDDKPADVLDWDAASRLVAHPQGTGAFTRLPRAVRSKLSSAAAHTARTRSFV